MANQISLVVTKDTIKISIPKTLLKKRDARKLTEDDVLKIVAEGNRELKQGKTRVVSSLRELLDR